MYKIFADDTSLFSKVLDANKFVTELNTDWEKIIQWAYQWKMQFNPDLNKLFFFKLVSYIVSRSPVKSKNNNTRRAH